uniref:Uncharacterized protein n=1 Tax=Cyprinus carpio TaxID=7962 RepID=A0A8C1V7V6_CYPCA
MILGEGHCLQNRPITAVVICVEVAAVTDSEKHQENSTALQLLVKMRGLLFLLSALFLLELIKGMKYDELNNDERKIVDEAIEEGNTVHGQGKHLDYYNIFKGNDNVLEVILRPTSCDQTTQRVHRKECKIHNKPPRVSCIHCNGAMKPCLLLKQKEEIKKRRNECQHLTGSGYILF